MNIFGSGLRGDHYGRFFWGLSFKNRKIIIPVLIVMILVMALLLLEKFISMENRLKQLSLYEPIYVLALKHELNMGDVIKLEDLKPMIFYKNEYENLNYKDPENNLNSPALISCNYDSASQKLSGFKDVVGRVVNIPIHANTLLRREYLAPAGTMPGLINLIEKGHNLIDIEVSQSGFNVFIKPNDQVDLYELNQDSSALLATKVKVLMVDSLPLGKAPLQVSVDSKSQRHLTLAVPEEIFSRLIRAKRHGTLMVTYNPQNSGRNYRPSSQASAKKSEPSRFQSLTIIQGSKKEIIKK